MHCPVCNQQSETTDIHCIQCRTLLKPWLEKKVQEEVKITWRDRIQETSIHVLVLIVFFVLFMFALELSFAIVTPQSYLMDFFLTYLAAPIAIGLGLILRNSQQKKDRLRRSTWPTLITNYILGYFFLSLVVPIIFLWMNTAFVRHETLIFRGKVIHKEILEKRKAPNAHLIYLWVSEAEENVSLDVPHDLYVQVPIGATLSACYKIGLFGIPFQWRKNYQGSCSYTYALSDA